MSTTKNPRRQPEPHATRVYLLVDRKTGKAFDCTMTRERAHERRDEHGDCALIAGYSEAGRKAYIRSIRIVPATATPAPPKDKAGAP